MVSNRSSPVEPPPDWIAVVYQVPWSFSRSFLPAAMRTRTSRLSRTFRARSRTSASPLATAVFSASRAGSPMASSSLPAASRLANSLSPSCRTSSAIRSGVAGFSGAVETGFATGPSARPTTIQERRRIRIVLSPTMTSMVNRRRARSALDPTEDLVVAAVARFPPLLFWFTLQRSHVPAIPRPGGEAVRPLGVGTTVPQLGAVQLVDGLEHPAVRTNEVELSRGGRRVDDGPGAAEDHHPRRVRGDALAFGEDDLGAFG